MKEFRAIRKEREEMGRYWNDFTNYSQPDTGKLQGNAKATARREKAKGKTLEPVVIKGRKIVNSWWGQAWCNNLERYADFESRLERGKRYVRTGALWSGLPMARASCEMGASSSTM